MTLYRRGHRFELRVRRHLESLGWVVFRSAGSRSPADLIALRAGEVSLIQCKVGGSITKAEREHLAVLAKELCCRAQLAYREGKKLKLDEVIPAETIPATIVGRKKRPDLIIEDEL